MLTSSECRPKSSALMSPEPPKAISSFTLGVATVQSPQPPLASSRLSRTADRAEDRRPSGDLERPGSRSTATCGMLSLRQPLRGATIPSTLGEILAAIAPAVAGPLILFIGRRLPARP